MTRRGLYTGVRKLTATSAILALGAASTVPAAALASGGPVAFAARGCSLVGKYRSLGPTYANDLTVSGTSCTTGYNVIKAFNRCRLAHGGVKGYCHTAVLGFRCTEKRSSSPIQFTSKTHCTNGRETVGFIYSEDI